MVVHEPAPPVAAMTMTPAIAAGPHCSGPRPGRTGGRSSVRATNSAADTDARISARATRATTGRVGSAGLGGARGPAGRAPA